MLALNCTRSISPSRGDRLLIVHRKDFFCFNNKLEGKYQEKFAKQGNEHVSPSNLGCGHCQNAKPKFLKASEAFADEPNKAFTSVDCTQDSGKSMKTNGRFLMSKS